MRNINTALALALSGCLAASKPPHTPRDIRRGAEQDAEVLEMCRENQLEVSRMLDDPSTQCDLSSIGWAMAAMNVACGENDRAKVDELRRRQETVEAACIRQPLPSAGDTFVDLEDDEIVAQLECVNAMLEASELLLSDITQSCRGADQFLKFAVTAEQKCSDGVVQKERELKNHRSWLRKMVALIKKKCKFFEN